MCVVMGVRLGQWDVTGIMAWRVGGIFIQNRWYMPVVLPFLLVLAGMRCEVTSSEGQWHYGKLEGAWVPADLMGELATLAPNKKVSAFSLGAK